MKCANRNKLTCDTSPQIKGKQFFVNKRMIHGVNSSGLINVPYERHCKATGLGICLASMFTNDLKIVCEATDIVAWISVGKTANAEMALETEAIDIITATPHATRKILPDPKRITLVH